MLAVREGPANSRFVKALLPTEQRGCSVLFWTNVPASSCGTRRCGLHQVRGSVPIRVQSESTSHLSPRIWLLSPLRTVPNLHTLVSRSVKWAVGAGVSLWLTGGVNTFVSTGGTACRPLGVAPPGTRMEAGLTGLVGTASAGPGLLRGTGGSRTWHPACACLPTQFVGWASARPPCVSWGFARGAGQEPHSPAA